MENNDKAKAFLVPVPQGQWVCIDLETELKKESPVVGYITGAMGPCNPMLLQNLKNGRFGFCHVDNIECYQMIPFIYEFLVTGDISKQHTPSLPNIDPKKYLKQLKGDNNIIIRTGNTNAEKTDAKNIHDTFKSIGIDLKVETESSNFQNAIAMKFLNQKDFKNQSYLLFPDDLNDIESYKNGTITEMNEPEAWTISEQSPNLMHQNYCSIVYITKNDDTSIQNLEKIKHWNDLRKQWAKLLGFFN